MALAAPGAGMTGEIRRITPDGAAS
jgi:hypothetical protein